MKTKMFAGLLLCLLPGAALAQNYCSDEVGYSVSTRGKGYDVSMGEQIDRCTPTAKKHVYACKGSESRYTLRVDPAGKGIKVTPQGAMAAVLLPCR